MPREGNRGEVPVASDRAAADVETQRQGVIQLGRPGNLQDDGRIGGQRRLGRDQDTAARYIDTAAVPCGVAAAPSDELESHISGNREPDTRTPLATRPCIR